MRVSVIVLVALFVALVCVTATTTEAISIRERVVGRLGGELRQPNGPAALTKATAKFAQPKPAKPTPSANVAAAQVAPAQFARYNERAGMNDPNAPKATRGRFTKKSPVYTPPTAPSAPSAPVPATPYTPAPVPTAPVVPAPVPPRAPSSGNTGIVPPILAGTSTVPPHTPSSGNTGIVPPILAGTSTVPPSAPAPAPVTPPTPATPRAPASSSPTNTGIVPPILAGSSTNNGGAAVPPPAAPTVPKNYGDMCDTNRDCRGGLTCEFDVGGFNTRCADHILRPYQGCNRNENRCPTGYSCQVPNIGDPDDTHCYPIKA